jgi:hypothetical protein
MMVALMAAQPAVRFGQLDAITLYRIDRADMDPVGTNDVGMLFDQAQIGHIIFLSRLSMQSKRARPDFVPSANKSRCHHRRPVARRARWAHLPRAERDSVGSGEGLPI